MKRIFLFIILASTILTSFSNSLSELWLRTIYAKEASSHAAQQQLILAATVQSGVQEASIVNPTYQNIVAHAPACADPTPELATHCLKMEQTILAATVRLELSRWLDADGRKGEYIASGISHATIKDGRYLVTHNHFGELLSALQNQGIQGEYIRLSLYRTDGNLILSNIPLTDVSIVIENAQTLVLALKGQGNLGFFEMMGLPSAEFAAWQNLSLQPGTEVAQIDWDGQTSYVRWTTINSLTTENGTSQISLTTYVEQGASGGGVFWNGYHIANNWFRASEQNQGTGEVLLQYSMAALNSAQVTVVATITRDVSQTASGIDADSLNHDLENEAWYHSY